MLPARQLIVVSRSLFHDAAATLVHAFVTSMLDHCSSVLVRLPLALIARLERVLRCVARIRRLPKYASVTACITALASNYAAYLLQDSSSGLAVSPW